MADASLVVVGAPNYDSVTGAFSQADASKAVPQWQQRFAPLPGTATEAEAIHELFQITFGSAPVRLVAMDATRDRVVEALPGQRYVHLATHGWFAPEQLPSWESKVDDIPPLPLTSVQDTVIGLAPLTLCGLALTGANVAPSRGLITAEEIAGLDLSDCELAVLSACETNVGIRRAGLGIRSLRTALHAAGARSSVTSLWKVDDDATRLLMSRFYEGLWEEGLGKADSLWRAKMALRDEGHPPHHWAGWVLTGDPD